MLRRFTCSLLRGEHAHSTVEYAVLIWFIALAALGGVVWIGGSVNRSLSLVAGGTKDRSSKPTAIADADGNADSPALDGAQSKAAPSSNDRIAQAFGAIVLGAGIIGLGMFALTRLRLRRTSPQAPLADAKPATLAERFGAKRQDLLRQLLNNPSILFKNQLAVRHLMTNKFIAVAPEESRQRIASLMRKEHIRHLLVCGPERKLLGVVSDRDVKSKSGKTAAELMCKEVLTISADTLMSPAITHIVQAGISSLPVVDDGRLCGIITTTDLILALQTILQVWLHAAAETQGGVWEQALLENLQSQLVAADAGACHGMNDAAVPAANHGRGESDAAMHNAGAASGSNAQGQSLCAGQAI